MYQGTNKVPPDHSGGMKLRQLIFLRGKGQPCHHHLREVVQDHPLPRNWHNLDSITLTKHSALDELNPVPFRHQIFSP